ncbi:4-oxalocrotonate tautomerase [Chakrabartyella piscis]|uniref:4-oxalocrotonate tautomerase n=1 Tax=Chakrabartyella piscis TaxID=2918914 RepID=UPI0029586F41|nr:4-oxalocrotonate tautomerase [Chakrabartyella piscis]
METKNLCAQIPIDLHQKVSDEREKKGITTSQYVTEILEEFYRMKEAKPMTKDTRTLALQISEELFERIKDHLQKTGMKQKDFIIGLILEALEDEEHNETNEVEAM